VFLRILLFVLLAPLAELVVLLWIADKTSWETAVAIILAGMLLGAWLIRRAGTRSLRMLRGQRAPEDRNASLPDALFTLAAGALFVVPGVLSDMVAVALLIPWTRRRIEARFLGGVRSRFQASSDAYREDRVIDVRVVTPRKRVKEE
jgi:UPF0716 protein FxsA